MKIGNLYLNAEPPDTGEVFEQLLSHRGVVIERILSSSRIVPGEYVQEQDEWVALLRGEASMLVAGENVALTAGDHLFLPARTPHTVLSVSQGALWLAVHIHGEQGGAA
ncbi:cupin domain-containing protein [Pseudoduganella violacea]|uniref:Cupin 2 domain-containing protein n=1 Tax=Pseudoduganella violacea TaxID=1715466 RepID=A0A7W5FU02_9BURK|nr:cupin domain-containing protein [Pseudoduganella violacea]MBB3118703.1 cupin 2 domain-containing protein [Pseudoduganella violacea]